MVNLNFLKVLIISFLILSCNKDEIVEQSTDINDVTDIRLTISNINTSEINAQVTFQFSGTGTSNIIPKILYKLEEENNYGENEEGIVDGLSPGRKYLIKAVIEINGKQKESEELSFVTLGFLSSNLVGKVKDYANREYIIYDEQGQANFTESAPLNGYMKVGLDSMLLENIEILNNQEIKFVIPKETQNYFTNAIVIKKEFSVGLFSGNYYVEIKDSDIGSGASVFVENDKNFTIYNKLPFFIEGPETITRRECDGVSKIEFTLSGGFRGHKNSSVMVEPENEFNSITITIRRNESDNTEIVSNFFYSSFVENDDSSFDCDLEQYSMIEDLTYPISMEHPFSSIKFSVFETAYPPGNYRVTFVGRTDTPLFFQSNSFDFTIE